MRINHKTVLKLMKNLQIYGKCVRRSKYSSYKGEIGNDADNLLKRDFTADKLFEKLATDVTEFVVNGAKQYLSPTKDMCNNEIISYSISKSPNFWQTREMLTGLFEKLPEGETPILHSDQGWQYKMKELQALLKNHGIAQSMSRKGNCQDNCAMESFFAGLKIEFYYDETSDSVEDFIARLDKYISYWNHDRIVLRLKGMSPVQYRTHSQVI